MSQQVLGTSEVVVVHHPEGIRHGCAKCGQIHLSGQYMVGVVIVEGGTTYNYLVGFDHKQRCCGEEKKFFPVFEEREAAELLCEEVRVHLAREKNTIGLPLLAIRRAIQ